MTILVRYMSVEFIKPHSSPESYCKEILSGSLPLHLSNQHSRPQPIPQNTNIFNLKRFIKCLTMIMIEPKLTTEQH